MHISEIASTLQQQKEKDKKKKDQAPKTKSSSSVKGQKGDDAQEPRPSTFKVWLHASRPHTLTASLAPVLVGSSLANSWKHQFGHLLLQQQQQTNLPSLKLVTISFAVFACTIQLGTNLHNDYADFIKGTDTNETRIGQPRATQKGWLTPYQTAKASTLCLSISTLIGMMFVYMTWDDNNGFGGGDGYVIFMTLTSVFNAFAYTGGEYPLGYIGLGNVSLAYSGLGDLFAFLYFGIVATISVPYLYVKTHCGSLDMSAASLLPLFLPGGDNSNSLIAITMKGAIQQLFQVTFHHSLSIGFWATCIIVVNNLRDRTTDVQTNKRTMAVRFGERFTRLEYTFLMLGTYVLLVFQPSGWLSHSLWLYLPIISISMAYTQLNAVGLGGKDGGDLNDHVGGTAKVQLLYCLLLSLGIRLS